MSPGASRNTRPWAVAGALIVVAGFVVALVSGGGANNNDSPASPSLPPGGTMTAVTNAPPPRPGDRVLAAGKTRVHDVHYLVVLSTPPTGAPLYINEYTGSQAKLLQRFRMPHPWTKGSRIADFSLEADPDPNPDKTATMTLDWFLHPGDQQKREKFFSITTHGVEVD